MQAHLECPCHISQVHSCRDKVEPFYYNYTHVRGCADLEWVCAQCGAGPNESPLDPTTCGRGDVSGYSGFASKEGRLLLPLCMDCSSKSVKPVTAGTTNTAEKERARQLEKEQAQEAKKKQQLEK